MPAPETPPRRGAALVVLGLTVILAVVTWVLLGRAADYGIDRLARLDRLHASCDSAWRAAGSRADTLRVDARPLPDTLDAASRSPVTRCGDLRDERRQRAAPPPSPREMSGEPMPRGLR